MVRDISTLNGTTAIVLVRCFDSENAPVIENELKTIIGGRPTSVIFDFFRTEYIASAGLRVLLSTTRTIMKAGGKVALSSLSPQVKQVFEIAGFTKIFSIFGTRDKALANLQKK